MLAFLDVGTKELVIILIVALLLFGSRLPSVMRSLGKGVVEFKRGLHDVEDEVSKAGDDEGERKEQGEGTRKTS